MPEWFGSQMIDDIGVYCVRLEITILTIQVRCFGVEGEWRESGGRVEEDLREGEWRSSTGGRVEGGRVEGEWREGEWRGTGGRRTGRTLEGHLKDT